MTKKGSARRRKRIIKTFVVVSILIVTVMVLEWIVLCRTNLFLGLDKKLEGKWVSQIDVTDEAALGVAMWMSDVQGAELTADSVYEAIGTQTIDVTWVFDAETHTYTAGVSADDYARVKEDVYDKSAEILEKLTLERIEYAGIDMNMVGCDIEDIIQDTLGMSTMDFLINQAPNLVISMDELNNQYAESGTYNCDGNKLNMVTVDNQPKDREVIIDGDHLVMKNNDGTISAVFTREAE